MLSMWLTQPISTPLQSGVRFLPHLLSAPPSVHLAMHFPLAGSDVDLPCSVGMTRSVRSVLYASSVVYPRPRTRKPRCSLPEEPRSMLGSLRLTTLTNICVF